MSTSQNDAIRNATNYSPSCPQINTGGAVPEPIDEDCLYLNVWAPRAPAPTPEGYPVMLWIHGGAFIEGSATTTIYDGLSWTNAAIKENNSFIMVSINYRLNVMGFFAQSALLDEKGQTIANQGIADQRIGLKWIRDNIAQFGGDKNAITLMGESAGSNAVCLHMVSPLSAGLFHTGILDSGPCDTASYLRDKSYAYSIANNLASLVGCNMTNSTEQLDCLRTVNSTLLVDATANVSIPPSTSLAFKNQEKVGGVYPFSVIVDEVEIPVHPLQAFLSGKFNQVSMLTGANHDEFLSRVLYEKYYHPPTSAQDYLTRILPIVTYNNSKLQQLYDPSQFDGNYTQAFVALLSQTVFLCGARRMAGYTSEQPTYLYTYTHTLESPWSSLPFLTIWPGAYHISELFTLFQTLAASFYGDQMFLPDELSLATSIRRYWTNMITKGQPNDNYSLTWPQYSSTTDQVLALNKNMTATTFIEVYPNCDLLSAVKVEVLGEYLGFNATCTVGNKCFIINSIATTHVTSAIHVVTVSFICSLVISILH
jgi:para-nitrobenzyl esterase